MKGAHTISRLFLLAAGLVLLNEFVHFATTTNVSTIGSVEIEISPVMAYELNDDIRFAHIIEPIL